MIPTYNAAASIAACLRALYEGSYRGDFEVIVVDSSSDETGSIVEERFPQVRIHRLARRAFPGDARNAGIARARGDVLAFIDADCLPHSDWLAEIVDAHSGPALAIGGVVDNANPESYIGWASYFCKFSRWMPQERERSMIEIPTCCLSIKRRAFDLHGPFPEGTLSSDTIFNWRLTRAGEPPHLNPRIRVAHSNRDRLGDLLPNLIRHGRDFAALRAGEDGFSRRRRLAFSVLSPLLPPLLFARSAARVARGRRHAGRFLLAAPLVLLGHTAWALGEMRGYLSGAADRAGR